jgi:nicotinamidase-related amidase
VVDVQKGVVSGAYQRDTVVANIRTLVARARAPERPDRLGPALR